MFFFCFFLPPHSQISIKKLNLTINISKCPQDQLKITPEKRGGWGGVVGRCHDNGFGRFGRSDCPSSPSFFSLLPFLRHDIPPVLRRVLLRLQPGRLVTGDRGRVLNPVRPKQTKGRRFHLCHGLLLPLVLPLGGKGVTPYTPSPFGSWLTPTTPTPGKSP